MPHNPNYDCAVRLATAGLAVFPLRAHDRHPLVKWASESTTDTAVVLTRVEARARSTGRNVSFPILQTLRMVDGRIAEVRPFYWDTAAIVAVLD